MRCSCGKPATINLKRREMPYCQSCFEQLIIRCIRSEAGEGPVKLKAQPEDFFAAVSAACALAKREIIISPDGKTPGCTETAAAATLAYLLGRTDVQEDIFPKTVTLEELQMFFKTDKPVILDPLASELIAFDQTYPGTTRSIAKYLDRQ